jgi:hypothetical protein
MIDLCCGLGGASAAMRDRGWQVTTYDCMADVKPDVLCDVRNLINLPRAVDLVWASPPCSQFTVHQLPFKSCVRARREPDMSVFHACKRLIDESAPQWWVIENVMSSRKWVTPFLGPVAARLCGHVLWGRLPGLLPDVPYHKHANYDHMWQSRKRHLLKSVIPYEISLAIALAVEGRLADESATQP